MKNIRLLIIGLVFAFAFFVPTLTKAEGIQISPLGFNFDISPGSGVSGRIIVTNINDVEMSYACEVENFNAVSDIGAPMFEGLSKDVTDATLADWVTFSADKEGTIAPFKSKEVSFTINVPAGADPGGHYVGIFARQVKKTPEGGTILGVANRVGALVLVTVPGEVTKTAQITEFTYPKFVWQGIASFITKVKNTGTIHYDSKSSVEIKPILGTATTVDLGTHTILPKNERVFSAEWAKKYPFGYYKLTATATDGDGNQLIETGTMWALPIVIVIPVIIALIALLLLVRYLRKHLRFVAPKN